MLYLILLGGIIAFAFHWSSQDSTTANVSADETRKGQDNASDNDAFSASSITKSLFISVSSGKSAKFKLLLTERSIGNILRKYDN